MIAAALLQTGRFRHADAVYVWAILAGSAVGLLASTLGRLYSSTYYALRDTRTPLRFALRARGADDRAGLPVRASASAGCSDRAAIWGAAGLTASAGLAGWIEMLLLRRAMRRAHRVHRDCRRRYLVTLWVCGDCGAPRLGWLVKLVLPPVASRSSRQLRCSAPYGVAYFGVHAGARCARGDGRCCGASCGGR